MKGIRPRLFRASHAPYAFLASPGSPSIFPFLLQVAILLVLVILAAPAPALAGPKIVQETLANGAPLLICESHTVPLVALRVVVKTGTLQEPQGKAGLNDLAAELLLTGTSTRSAPEIAEAIDFLGASLSAEGGYDYSTISLSILKKDWEKGLEILSDILLHPRFSEEEFKRKIDEKKASLVKEEEDPGTVAEREFLANLFGKDHPYGRPVEGTVEALSAIRLDDVIAHFQTFYLPGNAFLVVVGDVSPEEVRVTLDRYLSKWGEGKPPLQQDRVRPEAQQASRQGPQSVRASASGNPLIRPPSRRNGMQVIKVDRDVTQANVYAGHLGIAREDKDYYAAYVMNFILGGGGFTSRLMDEIRDNLGLAYSVYSSFQSRQQPGPFQIVMETKNQSANQAIDLMLKEINRLKKEGATARELATAKKYLTGSFPLRISTSQKLADFLVSMQFYHLGLDYIDRFPALIDGITSQDVKRAAEEYLHPETLLMVVVANQKEAKLRY